MMVSLIIGSSKRHPPHLLSHFSRRETDQIKLAYNKPVCQQFWSRSQGRLLRTTRRFFSGGGGNHHQSLLACHCSRKDGQAEWARLAYMNAGIVNPPEVAKTQY